MQKIIKLTESDLTQIVRLVIMENKKDNKINIENMFVGRSMVIFKNEDGEYCNVTMRHGNDIRPTYTVIFKKDLGSMDMATRPAMKTKVASRVNKMLMADGFKVV